MSTTINYKAIKPDNEVDKILCNYFVSSFRSGYIEIGEDKYVVPLDYLKYCNEYNDLEVYDSDVFVASHPKTGTTWTQEMVWLIVNNVDFEAAKIPLGDRCPFMELSMLFDYTTTMEKNPDYLDSVNAVKKLKSPRCIKTHFSWELLPNQIKTNEKQPKIIYVARNPKDTCVSYYYHSRLVEGYKGSFEEFAKLFLGGRITYGPFWKNILSYWTRRNQSNILFITYEEMKKDLPSIIRRVAEFLGKKLTEEQVALLNKHLSFESMKNNPAVNYEEFVEFKKKFNFTEDTDGTFMRSGIVGSFKAEMTPELIAKFDAWSKENLENYEFPFHELLI